MNYNKKRQGKSLYKDKEVNPERRDSIWITFQERLCDGSKKKKISALKKFEYIDYLF